MNEYQKWNQAIIDEFRANAGRVGGNFAGSTLLLLHTTGAKSGKAYTTPVMCINDADRLVIIASKAGAPSNPDWYYNILANPLVGVEVGTEQFQAEATVAPEPERTRLFQKMVEVAPGFEAYQQKTTRIIPVIILTRVH